MAEQRKSISSTDSRPWWATGELTGTGSGSHTCSSLMDMPDTKLVLLHRSSLKMPSQLSTDNRPSYESVSEKNSPQSRWPPNEWPDKRISTLPCLCVDLVSLATDRFWRSNLRWMRLAFSR
ncbi:hypothetical protein H257_01207 [Aphanomyces astaci]|uniref:Uncharacterized protein n=1 Tax=Aphanomyces astaci TaxID=112090 RepID=W4H8X8_APHAT|nr:hypothetical protein H257_01207 [Aphanomyces astaci]ETV87734.1 hypothetical protein H257_01207 [Aphanomyces astaci]|eukprot:XP_009822597.1 hypothetical protein H257_01207 [Aphanomyces astaci]